MSAFPLPVSMFSRDIDQVCAIALEEAWLSFGRDRENLILSSDAERMMLARGIVVAPAIGIRDHRRLVEAAMKHFAETLQQCMPLR